MRTKQDILDSFHNAHRYGWALMDRVWNGEHNMLAQAAAALATAERLWQLYCEAE